MRHATDADHVIAVTTILSRTRRFAHSTLIGALWGLGHSITVLVVGMAIIVFGIVIPPALGLAMELAVAVMLIVLGVLSSPVPCAGSPNGSPRRRRFTAMTTSTGTPTRTPTCTATSTRTSMGMGPMRHWSSLRDLRDTIGWYQLGRLWSWVWSTALPARPRSRLVLTTISDPQQALGYLVIFCAGVAAGMAILTTVIGLPFLVSRAARSGSTAGSR